jgi:hypothetical protein
MSTYDKIVNTFCVGFLESLSNEKGLMPLEIPKWVTNELVDDNIVDNKVLTRHINNPETAKGYAQLFTIAALVAELLQGGWENELQYQIIICDPYISTFSAPDYLVARRLLLSCTHVHHPARMQQLYP